MAIDGELVIFDPVSRAVHQLDPVGAVVWQFLDGRSPMAELVADLAHAFGTAEEQVRADVDALVHKLRRVGLLEREGPLGAPFPGRVAAPG